MEVPDRVTSAVVTMTIRMLISNVKVPLETERKIFQTKYFLLKQQQYHLLFYFKFMIFCFVSVQNSKFSLYQKLNQFVLVICISSNGVNDK